MPSESAILDILRMARPNADNPDMDIWLGRARQLTEYVDGHADKPQAAPQKRGPGRPPKNPRPDLVSDNRTTTV
jgi:hypothetical protein